jgi:hypothetical protein
MRQRLWNAAPLMVLGIALALLFYRLFLGDALYWGLPALQFTPWRDYAVELLRAGELPLWNPFNGAGAPLFANYQTALLYPLNWFSFFLPIAQTMSLLAVLHLFIAGCGIWLFMKRLGATNLGAGVSALAFGMGGYLVARVGTYPMIMVAAWLPWLLWSALVWLSDGKLLALAWLTVFSAFGFLAGHAQTMWYALLLMGIFILWIIVSSRTIAWRRLIGMTLAVCLGAGIVALQLIPTAELTLLSQRGGGLNDVGYGLNFSFAPLRLLTLYNANVFGTPADGSFVSGGAYFEDAVYIGIIPLAAVFAALILWRGKRRSGDALAKTIPLWLILIAIGLIFAFGRFTPIYPFIYQTIPTFDFFQAPARWNLWTVFGLAALAGIGASWWTRSRVSRRWAGRIFVVCLAFVLVGMVGLAFFTQGTLPAVPVLLKAEVTAGVFGLIAALLALYQPTDQIRLRSWSLIVMCVISTDLIIASWGLNPTINAAFYDRGEPPYPETSRAYWWDAEEEAVRFGRYFSFLDYRLALDQAAALRQSNLPNLNLLDRAGLFNNFDPLLVGSYFTYVNLLETQRSESLLRAGGIDRVYDQVGETLVTDSFPAYLVSSVCWHEDETGVIAAMSAADWQPQTRVELLGEGECDSPADEPIGEILDYAEQGERISYRADAAGWLVIAATDYPGWEAYIDGESVPIYQANLMFRAVPAPEGEHTVTFSYRPTWLTPSALISLFSLLCLGILFFLASTRWTYNENRALP